MNKIFKDRKYYFEPINGRWYRTTGDNTISLSHDVWNFFYPNDPVLKDEVIHHKNGDSSDDRIENLQKMKGSEHRRLHQTGAHHSDETKQKMRDANLENQYSLGHIVTDETKQKLRDASLGKHHTDETKQKIHDTSLGNQNMLGKHHTDETKQNLREKNLGSKNPNWKGGKDK